MKLHLLLTKEIESKMPGTTKVIFSTPTPILVIFDGMTMEGKNAIVEDTRRNIVDWLFEFDGVAVGVGPMMMEQFEIRHIKNLEEMRDGVIDKLIDE